MRVSNGIAATVFAMSLAAPGTGYAAGTHGDRGTSTNSAGEPGELGEVTRTVKVVMRDNAYTPAMLVVKKGETVRFMVRNTGELVHEFNIGTAAMHAGHQKEMMEMMQSGALEADRINHDKMMMGPDGRHGMAHDDPNSILLEPGKTGTVIWKFNTGADLEFACNVPGHYGSGMVGNIRVKD